MPSGITIEKRSFAVQFNEQQFADVSRFLGKMNNVPNKVLSRTLNDTIKGTKTDVSSAIREVLAAKKSELEKNIKTVLATRDNLSGSVTVKGVLPAKAFTFKQKSAGVQVKFYVHKPAEVIMSSFVARMKSSYEGIFIRTNRMKQVGRPIKKPWPLMPKEYRFPIRIVYAPSHVTILASDPVWQPVEKKIGERLQKALTRELNYEINVAG